MGLEKSESLYCTAENDGRIHVFPPSRSLQHTTQMQREGYVQAFYMLQMVMSILNVERAFINIGTQTSIFVFSDMTMCELVHTRMVF